MGLRLGSCGGHVEREGERRRWMGAEAAMAAAGAGAGAGVERFFCFLGYKSFLFLVMSAHCWISDEMGQ